jgi:hypothetical protein
MINGEYICIKSFGSFKVGEEVYVEKVHNNITVYILAREYDTSKIYIKKDMSLVWF